jgi:hypothetical protein
MDDGWMAYVCGDECNHSNTGAVKETVNKYDNAVGYYRDEVDAVLWIAKDRISNVFVDVYDRIIDILAMMQLPDVTAFQAERYYQEIVELLQDNEKHKQYVSKVTEIVTNGQEAVIAATLMMYPNVIIFSMGSKPARVRSPNIRRPSKDEFTTGNSYGGQSLRDLIETTSADTLTRVFRGMIDNFTLQDFNAKDWVRKINGYIDSIDNALENISTTEIEATTRRVATSINRLNSGLVTGYRRVAVVDNKTCVGCLTLHGKVYATNDEFESHPRCRCILVPITMTWMEYASVRGGAVPDYMSRDELIGMMPDAVLRDILGPGRYAMYEAGLPLERMIYIEQTAEYGHLIRITPLSVLREQGIP